MTLDEKAASGAAVDTKAVVTVADYLGSPPRLSAVLRAAQFFGIVAFACFAAALLAWVFEKEGGAASAILGSDALHSVRLPLAVVGVVLVLLCAACAVVGGRLREKHDTLDSVRKVCVRAMCSAPRFGVSPSTPFAKVGLRCSFDDRQRETVVCRPSVRFVADDFKGLRPSEFGAVDYLLADGRLIVFLTMDAKARYAERLMHV